MEGAVVGNMTKLRDSEEEMPQGIVIASPKTQLKLQCPDQAPQLQAASLVLVNYSETVPPGPRAVKRTQHFEECQPSVIESQDYILLETIKLEDLNEANLDGFQEDPGRILNEFSTQIKKEPQELSYIDRLCIGKSETQSNLIRSCFQKSLVLKLKRLVNPHNFPQSKPIISLNGQFICPAQGCSIKLTITQTFVHLKEFHPNFIIRHVCRYCWRILPTAGILSGHQRTHASDPSIPYAFRCPTCGLGFEYKYYFEKHLATHQNILKKERTDTGTPKDKRSILNRPCPCPVPGCSLKFAINAIRPHLSSSHPDYIIKFSCSFCPRVFVAAGGMNTHLKVVHGRDIKSEYKCSLCEMGFKFKISLDKHLVKKHRNLNGPIIQPSPTPFKEKYKAYKRWAQMESDKIHAEIEAEIAEINADPELALAPLSRRKYKWRKASITCPVPNCSESSRIKTLLLPNHLRRFHPEFQPKYVCSICQRIFHDSGGLYTHKRIHAKDPKSKFEFRCDFCDLGFQRKSYLLKHLRIKHKNQGADNSNKGE